MIGEITNHHLAINCFRSRRGPSRSRLPQKPRRSPLLALAERVAQIPGSFFAANILRHPPMGHAARRENP